jgi:L-ascorbate metabolism protein UlaG (beta-lactamase superfamily)
VPARHFSGRKLSNRFETLWAAFVLKGPRHNVYFGADTGLWPGLATIAAEYGPFDLTMLEIGAFNELWKDIHLGPDGAVEAFDALGGGVLMPIHWGLFDLALHEWKEPIERMLELAEQRGITLFSPEPGLPAEFSGTNLVDAGWWRG